jgi:hypothetical protein
MILQTLFGNWGESPFPVRTSADRQTNTRVFTLVLICMNFSGHCLIKYHQYPQHMAQTSISTDYLWLHKTWTSRLVLQCTNHNVHNKFSWWSVISHITTFYWLVIGWSLENLQFHHRQQSLNLCCLLVSQWWTHMAFYRNEQLKQTICNKDEVKSRTQKR